VLALVALVVLTIKPGLELVLRLQQNRLLVAALVEMVLTALEVLLVDLVDRVVVVAATVLAASPILAVPVLVVKGLPADLVSIHLAPMLAVVVVVVLVQLEQTCLEQHQQAILKQQATEV
jgi:hypothetical protein